MQGEPRTQRPGDNILFYMEGNTKQGTHRQGKYKAIQVKLTTQGKRDQKMTKWSVQILESGVGSAGFVELPVTLWKEVPEEIR